MHPDLFVWITFVVLYVFIAVLCVKADIMQEKISSFFLSLLGLAVIAFLLTLPVYFLNRAILSKTLASVDIDYRLALAEKEKQRPKGHWNFLEPPLPVFWPFPVYTRDMENSLYSGAKQKSEEALNVAAFRHPWRVVVSFLGILVVATLLVTIAVLTFNGEMTKERGKRR